MNSGVRVHTDRLTFERWTGAVSGLAIPTELRPKNLVQEGETGTTPVPPVVAAALALHGYTEVAVTLRITLPTGTAFGCFGLAGDLAASLFRHGDEVEVGLFDLAELVDQVVRLVPAEPPALGDADSVSVRICVLGADAAATGWQQTLVGGERQWLRLRSDAGPDDAIPVLDVRRELAVDLRLALADCLAGDGDA